MSGDAELNVDSLIARLLEGKLMKQKKDLMYNPFSSTWMSTRKNCSNE
jgi:hypothetical protein